MTALPVDQTALAPPAEWGEKPELRWLKIAELHIDQTYQRSIESRASQLLIKKIAANFRWRAFGTVLLCASEIGWMVLDGQHRIEAAKLVGIEEVPAIIIGAATTQEQAIIFVEANRDRVAVNPFALHHAMLAAGDPDAIELNTVCLKHRISIPRYPVLSDKLKPGETLALGTIKMLGRKYTPRIADAAIGAIAAAYRKEPGALRAAFFVGAAKALGDLVDPERTRQADKIAAALDGRPWHELQNRALSRRQRYRGTEADSVAAILKQWVAQGAVLPASRARLMAGR